MKTMSQTSWPTYVMSVGEVNDEGLPLAKIVNTRLSRVYGLAARQRVSLTLQGFDELTENEMANSSKTLFMHTFNIQKS
jgi:hypothetical protein